MHYSKKLSYISDWIDYDSWKRSMNAFGFYDSLIGYVSLKNHPFYYLSFEKYCVARDDYEKLGNNYNKEEFTKYFRDNYYKKYTKLSYKY